MNMIQPLVDARIQNLSQRIAAEFCPERIILFGSHARGEAKETSDVDLLVVLTHQGRNMDKAIEIVRATQPSFAVDVLVRTPEQVRERTEAGDFFLREITEQGRVLYESTDR